MGRILGKRIMLREYEKEDLIYIRKWVNNPNITKYLSDIFLYPHTLNETENFLDSILEGKTKGKNFIIANKDTEEYLGQIDLLTIDWKNRVGLLGIVLGQEANLGKGYGEEAIRLLLDYSFNKLNLNRIELWLHDFNKRAYRCYSKCGFKEEGRRRNSFYVDGKYTDYVLMGILKDEFTGMVK